MRETEMECRWLLVQAYALWSVRSGTRRLHLVASWRALGLLDSEGPGRLETAGSAMPPFP